MSNAIARNGEMNRTKAYPFSKETNQTVSLSLSLSLSPPPPPPPIHTPSSITFWINCLLSQPFSLYFSFPDLSIHLGTAFYLVTDFVFVFKMFAPLLLPCDFPSHSHLVTFISSNLSSFKTYTHPHSRHFLFPLKKAQAVRSTFWSLFCFPSSFLSLFRFVFPYVGRFLLIQFVYRRVSHDLKIGYSWRRVDQEWSKMAAWTKTLTGWPFKAAIFVSFN